MKKVIVALLIVAAWGCKDKNNDPQPNPNPSVTLNKDAVLMGEWKSDSSESLDNGIVVASNDTLSYYLATFTEDQFSWILKYKLSGTWQTTGLYKSWMTEGDSIVTVLGVINGVVKRGDAWHYSVNGSKLVLTDRTLRYWLHKK